MKKESCSICGTLADTGHRGDSYQVDCPRCGRYIISGTAVAMLRSRLQDATAIARTSHAIRSQSGGQGWFQVNSTNVDELITQPLPAPDQQLSNLLVFLKGEAGDNHFSPIALLDLAKFVSVVGAIDQDALVRLLNWAEQKGLLRIDGECLYLTAEAWEIRPKTPRPSASKQSPQQLPQKQLTLTTGHCPACGGDRKAEVMASHRERWDADEAPVWACDTYNILKCRGCETVYVQKEHFFQKTSTIAKLQMVNGNSTASQL